MRKDAKESWIWLWLWLLHKTFNKKSLSQKVKEGAFDNFQSMYVCTFNKMCVSQSLNILRKLNIWKLYIRRGFGILFSWFGSILTFQHATSDHLTWTEICIKIKRKSNKYNSWNSFENIKSISKNVNILTGNCILKSIIIVIRHTKRKWIWPPNNFPSSKMLSVTSGHLRSIPKHDRFHQIRQKHRSGFYFFRLG